VSLRGWLDRCPTWVRDLVMGGIAAEAAWATSDAIPILHAQGGWIAAATPLVMVGLAAVTRWTQAYGRTDPPAGTTSPAPPSSPPR
jgi:hypothetical protein